MDFLKLKVFIIFAIISSVSLAKNYKGDISANSFMVHYQNQQTEINHNEASTDSGYTSLNEESSIPLHGVHFEFSRELFASYLFSFTLSARYGKTFGSTKNTNSTSGLTYEEEASGELYGGGGSLNLNFSVWGMKLQPFIAAYTFTHENTYELKYGPEGATTGLTEINYESELQVQQYSLGMRFIDYYKGLLSYFSADYITGDAPTVGVSSNLDNLSNTSTPQRREYAFTIGFGALF